MRILKKIGVGGGGGSGWIRTKKMKFCENSKKNRGGGGGGESGQIGGVRVDVYEELKFL